MKTIQNTAAIIFIAAVAVLSAISILGVWEFFDRDVITKSFETLGLLALVAVIVMISGRFIEKRSLTETLPELPSPVFKTARQVTLAVLIVAVSLLALLGVLAIWEVIKDKEVLYKSLSSLGILAFGAFVMVMTCLERENKLRSGGRLSAGAVVMIAFLVIVFLYYFFRFIF